MCKSGLSEILWVLMLLNSCVTQYHRTQATDLQEIDAVSTSEVIKYQNGFEIIMPVDYEMTDDSVVA